MGIYGMDFFVVLGRRGNRVSKKKHARGSVGATHRLGKADAIAWFQKTYDGIVFPGKKKIPPRRRLEGQEGQEEVMPVTIALQRLLLLDPSPRVRAKTSQSESQTPGGPLQPLIISLSLQ